MTSATQRVGVARARTPAGRRTAPASRASARRSGRGRSRRAGGCRNLRRRSRRSRSSASAARWSPRSSTTRSYSGPKPSRSCAERSAADASSADDREQHDDDDDQKPDHVSPPDRYGASGRTPEAMGLPKAYPGDRGAHVRSRHRVLTQLTASPLQVVAPGGELAQRREVVARAVAADADDQVLDAGLDQRVGVVEVVGLDAPGALDLGCVAADVLAVLRAGSRSWPCRPRRRRSCATCRRTARRA